MDILTIRLVSVPGSNSANEIAISIVKDCIKDLEYGLSQCDCLDDASNTQIIYSDIGARQILELLEKNTKTPPLWVIEEYRDQMDEYMYMNSAGSYMFSVFHDIAEHIIDRMC